MLKDFPIECYDKFCKIDVIVFPFIKSPFEGVSYSIQPKLISYGKIQKDLKRTF